MGNSASAAASVCPLSSDEVLSIVTHLLQRHGRCPPGLTGESTIKSAFGLARPWLLLPGNRQECLGEICGWLNEFFGIAISQDEYDAALYPVGERTLGEFCDLIATQGTAPLIDPPTPKRVFEVLHHLLADAGADVTLLTPSTDLSSYVSRHWVALDRILLRITAGRVPPMTLKPSPAVRAFNGWMGKGFIGSWILAAGCLLAGMADVSFAVPWLFIVFCGLGVLCLVSMIAVGILAKFLGWVTVQPENLLTFDDLCRYLAAHLPAGTPDDPPPRPPED
ncbi:MAG: hypothetical protein JW955_20825 [Sedimentisphaerales bacterium]|nr:hypothetical protein [Sedimentisphaerales bacterium]